MAKICEICCEFIVLQDKRNTRYMDNGNENNISGREKFDMKAWMEEHPQEYGEFAAAMGEADLLEVFLLGSAAFNTSPEFQKRLENMIDLDNMDLDELLKILQESDFAEKIFGEQAEGSEWAKYRLPFAAWLKYGRSSEMMVDNIEEAALSIDNKQYQWQLAKFLKAFLAREVEDKRRSRKDLKEYLDYRKVSITAIWLIGRWRASTNLNRPLKLRRIRNCPMTFFSFWHLTTVRLLSALANG